MLKILNILKENLNKLLLIIYFFFILVFESKAGYPISFYFSEGTFFNLYFFYYDFVFGITAVFYAIWPLFVCFEKRDKREVILFIIKKSIENCFLMLIANLTLFFFSYRCFFDRFDLDLEGPGRLVSASSYALIFKIAVLILILFLFFLASVYFKGTRAFLAIEFPACVNFFGLLLCNCGYFINLFMFLLSFIVIVDFFLLFKILSYFWKLEKLFIKNLISKIFNFIIAKINFIFIFFFFI